MFWGCGAVTVIYLLLNFVFVTALSPAELAAVAASQDKSLTLGHAVAIRMLGETGGRLASAMVFLVQVSAVCAFTMTGPRVCDAMARDGFLPGWARWREGALGGLGPVGLVSGIAALLLLSNTYEALLNAVGVTLAIFGAMSATAVVKLYGRELEPQPRLGGVGLQGGRVVAEARRRAGEVGLPLEDVRRDYSFECDLLIRLNILRARATEVTVPAA
jgi:APA family basic amino acid/polyamine antiporter